MTPLEFQAVVMAAGRGSRMMELCVGSPKCLLPIGNRPMVWYPLKMLERAGFQDTILIVLESEQEEIDSVLQKCDLKIRLDMVAIPSAEDWGTADSLRFASDKIKTDAVIVTCDLVTDVRLESLLDVFRIHEATLVTLLHPEETEGGQHLTPGPKSKQRPERDIVVLEGNSSRLVLLASESDFHDTVPLPHAMLRKHQHLRVASRLEDLHVYVLRQWVLDYLLHDESFSTLKGELLPYLVKKQLPKRPIAPPGPTTISNANTSIKKDILQFAEEDPVTRRVRNLSLYNDHSGDLHTTYHGDSIRCFAMVAPSKHLGVRANTVRGYCQANRQVMEQWAEVIGDHIQDRLAADCEVHSTQMDERTTVGPGAMVAARTSIKGCHVGVGCVVESKTRLVGCVLMAGVTVREGAVLTNCVLCPKSEVGPGCELKHCLVGAGHSVPARESHTHAVLTGANRLMELD